MYKCSVAPGSLFPFSSCISLLLLHQSLFPVFYLIYAQLLFTVRGWSCEEGVGDHRGFGSWGVRAGRRWRRIEVMGVAALGVRRRRAALTVLLRRQVLAAGRWRWRERLWVVVEVAGVALGGGAGLERRSASRSVVAVAHVGTAGGGGRGKVAVGVGPVAEKEKRQSENKKHFFLLLSLGVERSKVTCVLHAWKAEQQLQLVEKESNAPMRHSRRTELQRQDADWAVGPQWQGVFEGVKNIGPTVKHSGSSGNHEGGQHLHLLCTVLKRRAWKPTNLPRIVAEYQPELCQMLVNGHQTHLIKC